MGGATLTKDFLRGPDERTKGTSVVSVSRRGLGKDSLGLGTAPLKGVKVGFQGSVLPMGLWL